MTRRYRLHPTRVVNKQTAINKWQWGQAWHRSKLLKRRCFAGRFFGVVVAWGRLRQQFRLVVEEPTILAELLELCNVLP
jgi:hypothetical protein